MIIAYHLHRKRHGIQELSLNHKKTIVSKYTDNRFGPFNVNSHLYVNCLCELAIVPPEWKYHSFLFSYFACFFCSIILLIKITVCFEQNEY